MALCIPVLLYSKLLGEVLVTAVGLVLVLIIGLCCGVVD
jgi:hypothetical protein